MSLIFTEGFDDGLSTLGKWTTNATTIVAGRNGNGGQEGNAGTNTKIMSSADEHATFVIGAALKFPTLPSGTGSILEFRSDSDATQHTNVAMNTSGTLSVRRGTTVLATSAQTLLVNQWYYVEFKATLHDTTGAYEVRVNGVTWLSASNVDTKNAGTKTVYDSFRIVGVSGSGRTTIFDDLYLLNGAGSVNNNFLGDKAIETLYPNGNGNSSQWVGSDGNSTDNYLLVDEATPDTADYTGSSVVGDKDTYAFGNLTRASGTINGVIVSGYAQKTDAGARTMTLVARSGTSESDSAAKTLATTYEVHSAVYETDPDGGAAWTVARVNSAEFGVKVAS